MINEVEKIKKEVEILKYYDSQPYFFSKDASAMVAFKSAIKALENQLKQKPQWHIVADGDLPKCGTDKMFLVSCEDALVTEMQYREKGWFSYQYQSIQDDVIAWQELPEPYIPKEYKEDTEKNCLNCRVTKEDLSQEICNNCIDYNKWC